MSEDWSVPGYEVLELIGTGASGEVWRAREVATGDTVALKRLREGADPAGLALLRREATLLRTIETPYVVRLRAVVGDVLVLDHAPGGSLASLLARRGALDAGEVVTIAAPLATGLAAAHAVGLVHGDVSPSNVLFTADGMPLLADLGVARLGGEGPTAVEGTAEYADPVVVAGGEPDTAADVWGLAAVCHHLLAGAPPHQESSASAVLSAAVAGARAPLGLLAPHAPRALVSAVEAALELDPSRRPDAAAFASLLRRSHAAAPVRLGLGSPPAELAAARETHVVRPATADEPAGRHRRPWRLPARVPAVGALVLAVVLAAGGGWYSGRSTAPAAAAVPALPRVAAPPAPAGQQQADAPAPAPDWPLVLTELDAARSAAFSSGDPGRLAQVWAAGSPGLAADTAALQALTSEGRTASGLRHAFRSVQPLAGESADGDRARLLVVDVLAGHEIADRTGRVVQRVPARAASEWVVELVRGPAGWRLASVSTA